MSGQDDIKKVIEIKNKRLQILKQKEATYGLNTPAEILIEIGDLEAEIEKLQIELENLEATVEPPPQINIITSSSSHGKSQSPQADNEMIKEVKEKKPTEMRVKDLLAQAVDSFLTYGFLLTSEQLALVEQYNHSLVFTQDEFILILYSALTHNYHVEYWTEEAVRLGHIRYIVLELIKDLVDVEQNQLAIEYLVKLKIPLVVEHLISAIEDEKFTDQDSPLYRSTPLQARALAVLAQMEMEEASTYLKSLVPLNYCFVPAGKFLMGSEETQSAKPEHEVFVPAFYIARCPVTNSQWKEFIADGGYQQDLFWSTSGWEWANRTKRRYPRHWWQSRFAISNNPTIGITWYEAIAYARWLAENTGLSVRLPTEAEWEKAASWDWNIKAKRSYPWGNYFDREKCNSHESKVGLTTPVGHYSPLGDSFCGAADMAGNVWEWTSSLYVSYPNHLINNTDELELPGERVVRGGSWMDIENSAKTTCRGHFPPESEELYIGCRIVIDLVKNFIL